MNSIQTPTPAASQDTDANERNQGATDDAPTDDHVSEQLPCALQIPAAEDRSVLTTRESMRHWEMFPALQEFAQENGFVHGSMAVGTVPFKANQSIELNSKKTYNNARAPQAVGVPEIAWFVFVSRRALPAEKVKDLPQTPQC